MHSNKSIIYILKKSLNSKMTLINRKSINVITYSFYIVLLDQVSKFLILNTLGFKAISDNPAASASLIALHLRLNFL